MAHTRAYENDGWSVVYQHGLINMGYTLRIDTLNRQALANQCWKVYRRSGDSIAHFFLCSLPDSHREILYSSAIKTKNVHV